MRGGNIVAIRQFGENVAFGSGSEVSGDPQEGPHLRAEQTKSGGKRTLPLKGRLSGAERTYSDPGLNSRS